MIRLRRSYTFAICATLVTGVGCLAGGCGSGYQSSWDEDEPAQARTAGAEELSQREQLMADAEAAWGERDDPDRIRAAIAAWERALEIDGSDADTWVKVSRAYYLLTDGHLRFSDPEAMPESFQSGIRAAERALRIISPDFARRMAADEPIAEAVSLLEENAVPALYWRATNLGKWSQVDGFATVLANRAEIVAMMTRCLEADRYYFFGGPDRYFGAVYAIAPTFAGGDLDRSRQHFEESLRRYPNYIGTRVLFAEHWAVKAQNRQVFEEQLRLAIEADPEAEPDVAAENRIEQRKARDLLERADELFMD